MESVPSFLDIAPEKRLTSNRSHPKSWITGIAIKLLKPHSGPPTIPWSKLRIRTIRRDHYRCRACDKKGDEITLVVHRIHPDVFHATGLLTLCPLCETLARRHRITAQNIPQFLQVLWRHLHHVR